MPVMPGPTLADIERIAAVPDAVMRNLQITQCYHELALVMKARIAGSANWCSFAAWASKQAGQTIRKQDLARTLEAGLGSQALAQQAARQLEAAALKLGAAVGVEQIIEVFWKAYDPEAAFERSSSAVARGNLKVFAEIGREFARFHAECLPDEQYAADSIERFCAGLRPGDPPDGQDTLRRAFAHYYQALFAQDAPARAEWMLLGNLEIGYHEQTRLQPEINAALVAPVLSPADFANQLLKVLTPGQAWLNRAVWSLLRIFGRLTAFDAAAAEILAAAQREAQRILTESMMTLEIPPQLRLRLGEDLPAGFPPVLQRLTNPELLALLARIDPTPDSTRESGAIYWGDFPDRMHFIADLFRCYQVSAQLDDPPFTPEQVSDLKAGRLPSGRL